MNDEKINQIIERTVQTTIKELKKNGLLKDSDSANYADASEIISSYYRNGKKDAAITYAIQGQRFDPYFRIIDMYFGEHMTVERIAGRLAIDASTVVRNKKRLCLAIYNDII